MQDYYPVPIRTAAILTGSYVIGDGTGSENIIGDNSATQQSALRNQLMLYVDFTIGSLTSCEIKIEFSNDNSTWYQETIDEALSTDVIPQTLYARQLTASGQYRIAIPTKDRFIRVSAKGTGTATGSSLAISGAVGIA